MASDIDSLLSIADSSLTGLTRRGSLPRPPRLIGNAAAATSAMTAAVNAAAAAAAAKGARATVDSKEKEEARNSHSGGHATAAPVAAASSGLWGSPIDLQAQVAALQATANGRGPPPATVYPPRHSVGSNNHSSSSSAAASSTPVASVSSHNAGSTTSRTPRASSSTRNPTSSSFVVGAGGLPTQLIASRDFEASSPPIERVLTRPPNLRQKSMGAPAGNGPLVLPAAAGATHSGGATTERGGSAGASVRFAAIPPSAARSVGSSAGVLASPRGSSPAHPPPMSPLMAPLLLQQHSTPLSSSPAPNVRGLPSSSLPTSPILNTLSPTPPLPLPYHHISGPVPFAGSLLATSDLDYHATIQRRVAAAGLLPVVGSAPSAILSPTPSALHQSPPLSYRPTPPKFHRASSIGSPITAVVASPQHTPVPPAASASIFVSPLQLGEKAAAAPVSSRTPRTAALATINLNAASPLMIGASSSHFPMPPPMNLSRRGTLTSTSTRLALQMPLNDEQISAPVMVAAGGGSTPPPALPPSGTGSAPNSARVPQPPTSPSTYFRSMLQPSPQPTANTPRVSFAGTAGGAPATAPDANEAPEGTVRRNSRKSFIAGATPLAPGLVAMTSSASPSPASVLSSPRTPRHQTGGASTSPARDRLGSVHWEDDTSAVDLTNRVRARSISRGAASSRASSAGTERSPRTVTVTDEDGTVNNEELEDEREQQREASRRTSNATPSADAAAAGSTSDTEPTANSSSKPNSRRGTLNKFALVDPITGLPLAAVQAKRRASAVYMGMLPDQTVMADSAAVLAAAGVTSPSHDGRALSHEQAALAAQQVLNSLSPLHAAALHQSTSSAGANSVPVQMAVGELALSNMMSAVRVKQVELAQQRVAPTLMQQAKVITAAIILQKQARLAERRAVLQKRQAEQDAYEAALEAQHAVADAAAREARIREQQAMLERTGSASFSPRSSAAGAHLSAFSGSGGGPRSSREGGGGGESEPRFRPTFLSKRSSLGQAFDFSEFDFSGSGTAWGKDAIGSHLLRTPRSVAPSAPAAPAAPEIPPPIVPHSTGFGSGLVSDNNGAHHPLMNPSHPNFMSHLNPNSSNYNSHINPRHANFNPLNNPAHPEHDPKYNNPRSEHFNPFYNHPKFRMHMQGTTIGAAQKKETNIVRDGETEDLVEALKELHAGSTNHPAHPSHPLFTPHHAEDLVAMLPQQHPVLQIVTKEWAHAQAIANVDAASASPQPSPRATADPNTILTPHGGAYKWGRSAAAASPTSVTSPSVRSPSPRRGGNNPQHAGLSAFQAKRAQLAEKRQQGAASLMQQAKAALRAAAEGHEYIPITARPGVSLTQQLSELSPQQLEQLRRETINTTLGMHDSPSHNRPGRSSSVPTQPSDSPSGGGITMSKFFRDTLQQALGGDEIWQMAKDIHNEGGKTANGKRGVTGEGISLSSLSLQAHMALFGAGALTDSDGRPLDSQGNYLDLDADSRGPRGAVAIAPFPPKKFFLDAEVERYEQELRLQLMRDHETRVREFQDMVNLARRKWHAGREGISVD